MDKLEVPYEQINKVKHENIVLTLDECLFCGSNSDECPKNNHVPLAYFSLMYTQIYLNLDCNRIKKAVVGNGQPDNAREKKLKKNLIAALCPKCANINDTISSLFFVMENAEIELQRITGELKDICQARYAERSREDPKPPEEAGDTVEAIALNVRATAREEIFKKCAKKVSLATPRVLLKKLTPERAKSLKELVTVNTQVDVKCVSERKVRLATTSAKPRPAPAMEIPGSSKLPIRQQAPDSERSVSFAGRKRKLNGPINKMDGTKDGLPRKINKNSTYSRNSGTNQADNLCREGAELRIVTSPEANLLNVKREMLSQDNTENELDQPTGCRSVRLKARLNGKQMRASLPISQQKGTIQREAKENSFVKQEGEKGRQSHRTNEKSRTLVSKQFQSIARATATKIIKKIKSSRANKRDYGVNPIVNCPRCQKLVRKYSLQRHMEGVHGKNRFTCTHCDRGFKFLFDYKRHQQRVHNQENAPSSFQNVPAAKPGPSKRKPRTTAAASKKRARVIKKKKPAAEILCDVCLQTFAQHSGLYKHTLYNRCPGGPPPRIRRKPGRPKKK